MSVAQTVPFKKKIHGVDTLGVLTISRADWARSDLNCTAIAELLLGLSFIVLAAMVNAELST